MLTKAKLYCGKETLTLLLTCIVIFVIMCVFVPPLENQNEPPGHSLGRYMLK
jgi:hypothetical protein